MNDEDKKDAVKVLTFIRGAAAVGKIGFAGGELVVALEPEVGQVMKAMGIKRYFVSDESAMSDFGADYIATARANLPGLDFGNNDYVWQVAAKLKGIL